MSKCNPVPAKKAASEAGRPELAEGIEAEAKRTAGVCGGEIIVPFRAARGC